MMHQKFQNITATLVLLGLASSGWSAPVIEGFDRFELNWSSMKIRYYGEAVADFASKGFVDAERSAAEDGQVYALNGLGNVRSEKGLGHGYKNLPNDLTKQAYVFQTNYYGDGRVKVEMEASLVRALDIGAQSFKAEDSLSAPSDATAIVIAVKGLKNPRMLSAIYDEQGEIVHDATGVVKTAYRRSGLGRWFYRNSAEARTFVGSNPLELEAVFSGGRLVVKREDWDRIKGEHPRLLDESRIAYLLLGSGRDTAKKAMSVPM